MMLYTLIGLLILFWILGFVFHIAGGFIHILLVLAVIVVVVRLISGRSAV